MPNKKTRLLVLAALVSEVVVPFHAGLASLLCLVLVWAASYGCGYILPTGQLRRVLTWIGHRSYAIYLIHPFAYALTREFYYRGYGEAVFNDRFALPFLLTAVVLIAFLADLNYRWLEVPLRRRGRTHAAELQARLCG